MLGVNDMPKLRMAVFGSGHGFATLIPAALKTDLFQICAAEPRDISKIELLGSKSPIEIISREVLIRSKAIDLAVIAVPPFEQLELASKLALNTPNLYIEKPGGLNSLEAKELLTFSNEYKSRMYVGLQFRFDPAIKYFREIIVSSNKDELNKVTINWHTTGSSGGDFAKNWRNDSALGGGVHRDFLIHVFDYLIFLFGIETFNKRTDWILGRAELDEISIFLPGPVETQISISRGKVAKSFWEISLFSKSKITTIRHSAPFDFRSYDSKDESFLQTLRKSMGNEDVRIHSTSLLFEAIENEIRHGASSLSQLPTVQDSLAAYEVIEEIFQS